MVPLHVGQKIIGTVEKLVYGGAGLIRHQGIVIFVRGVIPGEVVEVTVTEVKARYAEGRLLSLPSPSEHRIQPHCPYYGRCGGCQLQHINPSIHPSLKKEWLHTALHKILPKEALKPVEIPMGEERSKLCTSRHEQDAVASCAKASKDLISEFVPAQQIFGWRRKITLHGRWQDHRWIFGFIANDNISIIPISWCPLFCTDDEHSLLQLVTDIIAQIPGTPSSTLDLTFFRLPEQDMSIILSGSVHLSKETAQRLLREVKRLHTVRTVSFRLPRLRHDKRDTEFVFNALQKTWHYSLDAFIQNHPSLSELLWADIIDIVDSAGPHQSILDLYAGIGVTAVSLAARGHNVTAVELSEAAVRAAQMSAEKILKKEISTSKGRLTFLQSSVEAFLANMREKCDWIIVNPPRTGLSKEVTSRILKIGPKRIVYVSCSPPTMARDLALLHEGNWNVVRLKGYDMFPQTTHFETIAVMEKKERK